MTMTIPKKIHYCWLSDEPLPDNIQKCLNSWKRVMPDYEIIRWDTKRFDIHSVPFVYEAYQAKKWAFAADYIRLYALYHEGGVYLDSDVYVLKSFEALLIETVKNHAIQMNDIKFFSAVEKVKSQHRSEMSLKFAKEIGIRLQPVRDNLIQAAVMGSIANHSFIKRCLDWYDTQQFFVNNNWMEKIIAPDIYAYFMTYYGFNYQNIYQQLDEGVILYPSSVFPNGIEYDDSYAVHWCEGSWRNYSLWEKMILASKRNPTIRKIFGKQRLISLKDKE